MKCAKDKPIMEKKVSPRNILIKFNKLRNKYKEKKKKKIISLSTANSVLNKHIGNLLVIRRVFYLKLLKKLKEFNFVNL